MPKTICCPFWKWDAGKSMSCEFCRMTFPDGETKQDYARRYCASLEDWEKCSFAGTLLEFYERDEENAVE